MDFSPNMAQKHWISKMKSICKDFITPSAADVDADRFIPRELYVPFVSYGFSGLLVGEKYGGVGERASTAVLVGEILASSCSSTYFSMLSPVLKVAPAIEHFASDWLKSRFLPDICTGRIIGGWAFQDASDTNATVARYRDGQYVLNGCKSFAINAANAEFFLLIAHLENKNGPRAAFIVDRRNKGLKRGHRIKTSGLRGAFFADLELNECTLSEKMLVARDEACEAMIEFVAKRTLLGRATFGLGILAGCISLLEENFADPAKNKTHRAVQKHLVQLKADYQECRNATLKAADNLDMDNTDMQPVRQARMQTAGCANSATERCVEFFGRQAYISGNAAERYWRDSRYLLIPCDLDPLVNEAFS